MSKEFRHIARVVDTDLNGTLKVMDAICSIKGVGKSIASVIVKKGGINPDTRLGFLSDEEISRIEDIVKNPSKYNIPGWLFNRQKDLQSGKDLHLIGSDLVLQNKTDIDNMRALKSWKGYRHSYGLKVRGQRTKTTGRKGKAIGVKKKSIRARGG